MPTKSKRSHKSNRSVSSKSLSSRSSSNSSTKSIKQLERREYLVDELSKQFNNGQPANMFHAVYINEIDKNGKPVIEYRVYRNDQKCASVSIHEKDGMGEILVLAVDKCNALDVAAGSGTYILNRLIEFSKKEGFSLVIEADVSKIMFGKIEFSLTTLYILTTGHSWYNSIGFYEDDYDENKRNADEFIQGYTWTNTADFRKYVYTPMVAKRPNVVRFTIQQVFTYVMDRLKNKADPPDVDELKYYKKLIKPYNDKLFNNPDKTKRVSYHKQYMLVYKND